jgi:hypothetical protein
MPELGHSRHSDHAPITSGLPRKADIFSIRRHVSKVPSTDYPAKYASGVVDLLFIPCCKAEKQSLLF